MSERKYCVKKCYDPCCKPKPCDPCCKPCIDPCNPCCKPCDPCCRPCIDPCKPCCDPCCMPIIDPRVPNNFLAPFDPNNRIYDPCCNQCCNPCPNNCCNPCCKPCCGCLTPQSFGTFANNQSETVPVNRPFSFNQVGRGTSDICLAAPSMIRVQNAGVYNVFYNVGVNVTGGETADTVNHRVNLYANFVQQSNSHPDFSVTRPISTTCYNISGCATVCLPQNGVISLMNDSNFVGGSTITTCANGTSPVVLSIARVG